MLHTPPTLLNEDGSASMATMLLMSHHGLRRDVALFIRALGSPLSSDPGRTAALQEEWRNYHGVLHGHHEAEDQRMFPHLRAEHPELATVIDQLTADHRRIDPLLDGGDRAFAQLPTADAALSLVSQLSALLDAHLATEEQSVVPFLRSAKGFPPPASDEELQMFVQGFAWSSHGIDPQVLERVYANLPEALTSRLPAARAAFEQRCARAWGSAATGASRTARPDWLPG